MYKVIVIGNPEQEPQTIGYFDSYQDAEYYRDGFDVGLEFSNNTSYKAEIDPKDED